MTMDLAYLASAVGLVQGLKLMGDPARAKQGNMLAALSVIVALCAVAGAAILSGAASFNILLLMGLLLVGTLIGKVWSGRIAMTSMPQLVSIFNALGGACAVVLGLNAVFGSDAVVDSKFLGIVLVMGAVLGGTAFTGSLVAFMKLDGRKLPRPSNAQKHFARGLLLAMVIAIVAYLLLPVNSMPFPNLLLALSLVALIYGIMITLPIGGADMPVLIALLNALTGVATFMSGLLFHDPVMIIGGILVGATGLLLTGQMCIAMNRSLRSVLAGAVKINVVGAEVEQDIRQVSAVETASLLAFSDQVAIVPGYGMAVSQAQRSCAALQKLLEDRGSIVHYIIHPVAGRMPGHMNVLLAEASIEYESILGMDEANPNMKNYDAVLVIGANDVVNPSAEDDPNSSIYGMPIIKAYKAEQVIVMKRGMAKGYSGVTNTLFDKQNCRLLFGDANSSLNTIINELKRI